MSKLPKPHQQFKAEYPAVAEAYSNLGEALAQAGPLDGKTRELIKLGIAAANKAESAVKSHAHRALEAGATVEEVEHAILLSLTNLGLPAMMAALRWARSAVREHAE